MMNTKVRMHIGHLFFLLSCTTITAFHRKTPVGSLFQNDDTLRHIFKAAVEEINLNFDKDDVLAIKLDVTSLSASSDILETTEKICRLLESGITAVFGHLDPLNMYHLQSICDSMEIPFITVQWDPNQMRGKSINLYPNAELLSEVFPCLIKEMEWKSFAVLYEGTDSLIRLNKALTKKYPFTDVPISFYRIIKDTNYRFTLKQIKDSGERNLIIDCSYDILESILQQSLEVGIITEHFNLIITSLDLHTIDLSPYQYSGVNLTGVRIVQDEENTNIQQIMTRLGEFGLGDDFQFRTEHALIYDSVKVFAEGFKRLKFATKGDIKHISCNDSESWEYGISLTNFIKSVEIKGLTGPITFDTAGFRSDFDVSVFSLDYSGIKETGKWTPFTNLEWFVDAASSSNPESLSLHNTTFRVLIALTRPYGMLRETVSKMSGNEQYEGFAIDIIYEISKILGFNYTFSVQADNVYGSLNPETKQWNGMLRKVMDNEADLAITDLTITAERERAVDFTMPFMNLGISILYQKPKAAPPSLMSFLLPFSTNVWLYLIGVYIIVSTLFFVLGRMCPAEWNNIYPCIEDPDELENQFTFRNSLWFCIGAMMQQGSEIAPIGYSTRMLAGFWWLFCLIIANSYTANLAAFLTVETVERPIKNAEGLANQNAIKYGAKIGGSTINFFRDSNSSTYAKMYQYMIDNAKEVLTAGNDEGKRKVLTENYAFLMESSSIEYIQERECNLSQIGGLLDQKGYGIAMRKNVSYRNDLSRAVLKLQEMGILTSLKNKWWKEKGGGGRCQEDSSGNQAEELGLANVGGVFLVLIVGVALSFIGTIMEFMYNIIMTSSKNESIKIKDNIKSELKFIIKFGVDTKPVNDFEL